MIFKEGLPGFGRIHHRFLNDLTLLERFRHRPPSPHLTEVAEGDLCWYVNGSEIVAAFVHPSGLNRIPTLNEVRAGIEQGSIAQLDDVLDRRFDDIPLVVELKTGVGDVTRAMEYILDRLEGAALGRYWVDSFSPGLLATVKKVSPGTPTSLHTRLGVYGPLLRGRAGRVCKALRHGSHDHIARHQHTLGRSQKRLGTQGILPLSQ